MMNGYDSFEKLDLDDDNFAAQSGTSIVSAFDAFRTDPSPPSLSSPTGALACLSLRVCVYVYTMAYADRASSQTYSKGETTICTAHIGRGQVDSGHGGGLGHALLVGAGAVVARGRGPHVRRREGRRADHADQPRHRAAHEVCRPARLCVGCRWC